MKIGIVGLGVVGSAAAYGFEVLGHTVVKHDTKLGTKLSDLLDAEIIYICVPTKQLGDGSCDTSIVENVVDDLMSLAYGGIIAIKSTVTPGTTDRLIAKHNNKNICFQPETLKERSSFHDFQHQDICVVGTDSVEIFNTIIGQHGRYVLNSMKMTTVEAELFKYCSNNYNTTLIVFANSFYEICKSFGCEWNTVKAALVKRGHVPDMYLDVNDNLRGASGPCLGKDLSALVNVCKEKCPNVKFFESVQTENDKYKETVLPGMRPE